MAPEQVYQGSVRTFLPRAPHSWEISGWREPAEAWEKEALCLGV